MTSAAEPIRVAIIDDDSVLVDGLCRIIGGADGFTCAGAFGSVEEALTELPGARPDVVLLDIQLPGTPGDEAVRLLRGICPASEILMLTVFSDRANVFTSLCNGANGYLLKSTPPAKLLDAIRSARMGGSPLSPEIARQIIDLFRNTGPAQPPAEVTPQETKLLTLLAEGYSYQSAADQMHVSVNTIRNYIRSIYEKLHVHSKSAAVGEALRRGFI